MPLSTPRLTFAVVQHQFPIRSIAIVQIFNNLIRRRSKCLIHIQKLEGKNKTKDHFEWAIVTKVIVLLR